MDIWGFITGSIIVWGVLAFLLIFVFKFPKKAILKNKKWDFVVLLVIGLFVTGIISTASFSNLFSVTGVNLGTTQNQADSTKAQGVCQQPGGSNTNSVLINARNQLNSLQDYMTITTVLLYNDGGESAASALTGGTKTYTTFNSAPCKTGYIYGLSSATQNGFKVAFDSYSLTKNYDILGANSSRITILPRDTTFTSITGNGNPQTGANTSQQTMAQGSVLSFYMDLLANETAPAQFGIDDGGVIISVDYGTGSTSFSTANGISISNTDRIGCETVPNLVTANSADVCFRYKNGIIKSSDGVVRLQGTLTADLGNPAAGDDVTIYIDDVNYGRDTDGSVKLLAKDTGGTDIGESRGSLVLDLA